MAFCHASGVDHFNVVITFDKDVLDFIASLIRSLLSWPVAFVVALVIFFKPLKHLLERLRKAKLPGVEIDVSDTLVEADARAFEARVDAEVKKRSKAEEPATTAPAKGTTTPDPAAEAIHAPRREREARSLEEARRWGRYITNAASGTINVGKVLETAWKNLSGAISDLYDQSTDSPRNDLTVSRKVEYLRTVNAVDDAFVESFQRLWHLNYSYRFGGVLFTHNEATAFASTAKTLQSILEDQTAYPDD